MVELETLASKGIWALTIANDGYPARLQTPGDVAPPCIFGVGEAFLLQGGGVAVVESRDAEPDGARVAQQIVEAGTRLSCRCCREPPGRWTASP